MIKAKNTAVERERTKRRFLFSKYVFLHNLVLILTSSTIDKKLEIYTKLEIELEIYKNLEYELEIDKNLENFESNFEFFVNFEFIFEFFVISSFLSMVDELTISLHSVLPHLKL